MIIFQTYNPKADKITFKQNAVKVFKTLNWKYSIENESTFFVVKKAGYLPTILPISIKLTLKHVSDDCINIVIKAPYQMFDEGKGFKIIKDFIEEYQKLIY